MIYNEMYLEFSLDYDVECEDITTFEVDGQDFSDDLEYDKVNEFVKELMKLEDFYVSEHRTEVEVHWKDDKMNVFFRFFNEPEDGEFDDYELKNLEPIEFDWNSKEV